MKRWLTRLVGAPATLLLAAIGVVLAAVQGWAPAGGIAEPLRPTAPGKYDSVRLGDPAYPRTAREASGYAVRLAHPARRVVSRYWSIDELVYSVIPPERITGVSESAYQERISNVAVHVKRYKPIIATDAERVLRSNPDLVLDSSTGRADFTSLMRLTDTPVLRIHTLFTTLDQVMEAIHLTGYVSGEDEAAAAEYQRFQSAVQRAKQRRPAGMKPPRILGFGGRYSYGSKTLFHDIVKTLGGVNVGAEGGLLGYDAVNTEQILRWDPEWIVAGADKGKTKQQLERIMADPAISLTQAVRNGRVVVFEHHVFLAMSPFTRLILEALGDRLYGS